MKNSVYILSVLFICFLLACNKNDAVIEDCSADMLEALDMKEYNGEDIGCNFFLWLYEWNNAQYFVSDSNCADISHTPIDCDGNAVCEDCRIFFSEAERIGIIGISK